MIDRDKNTAHNDRALDSAFDDRGLGGQPKKFFHRCPDCAGFKPMQQEQFPKDIP